MMNHSYPGIGVLPALLNESSPPSTGGSGVPLLVSAQMGYPPAGAFSPTSHGMV
jgi:hypothetical protein